MREAPGFQTAAQCPPELNGVTAQLHHNWNDLGKFSAEFRPEKRRANKHLQTHATVERTAAFQKPVR